MSLENLDVKNIYVIGENLKTEIGQELGKDFSGQKLVSWLLEHDVQVCPVQSYFHSMCLHFTIVCHYV